MISSLKRVKMSQCCRGKLEPQGSSRMNFQHWIKDLHTNQGPFSWDICSQGGKLDHRSTHSSSGISSPRAKFACLCCLAQCPPELFSEPRLPSRKCEERWHFNVTFCDQGRSAGPSIGLTQINTLRCLITPTSRFTRGKTKIAHQV